MRKKQYLLVRVLLWTLLIDRPKGSTINDLVVEEKLKTMDLEPFQ